MLEGCAQQSQGPLRMRRARRVGRTPIAWLTLALSGLFGLLAAAHADEPVPAGEQPVRQRELAEQNARLMAEIKRLRDEVTALREDHNSVAQQVTSLLPLGSRLSGYLDFGFFYVGGDGTGIRPDTGYVNFPEYRGQVPDTWVFMGDPLATTINSRGDPANTGESRAITLNPIKSGNKPTFILNPRPDLISRRCCADRRGAGGRLWSMDRM